MKRGAQPMRVLSAMEGPVAEPRASDARTFEDFFAANFNQLQAIAFALTGRRVLAEELAQEAMIAVYKRWGEVSKYDDPAGFARRVVSNKAVSTFRRLTAEARALNRVRSRAAPPAPEISATDAALWQAVRSLPRRQALAITLKYVADLDAAAIGIALGCAESTARVLLHRGRQRLSDVLSRELEEDD